MNWIEREERSDDEEAYRMEDLEDYKVFKSLLSNGFKLNSIMNKEVIMLLNDPMTVTYISDEKVYATHRRSCWFQSKQKKMNGTVFKLRTLSRHFCKRNKISVNWSSQIFDYQYFVRERVVELLNLDKNNTYIEFRRIIGQEAFRVHNQTHAVNSFFVPKILRIKRSSEYNEDICLECIGFIDNDDLRFNYFILENT